MRYRHPDRKQNAFIYIIGGFLSFLERRLGVFGPFSVKLVLGMGLGLASLFLFAKLAEDLLYSELAVFDQSVTAVVRTFVSPQLTTAMTLISWLGSPGPLITAGAGMMIFAGRVRRHGWDTGLVPITIFGGFILNESLKRLFHRPRPNLPHLVGAAGYSFPSGHAMMSLIVYGLIIYLLWVNLRGRWLKTALFAATVLLILAIGLSRIYLGVHYPSDVVAGFAAGSFWLTACIIGRRGIHGGNGQQE